MQAAHGSSQPIVRDALLSDVGIQTSRCELMLTPSASEETAFILSGLDIY